MIVKVKQVDKSVNFGAKDSRTNRTKVKYDNCHDNWVPGLSKSTGMLNTGLTKEEEVKFEKALSLPSGSLAKGSDYWNSFSIIIPEEGLILNTENPDHELKYKLLLADPYIVEGEEQLKFTASAEYIISTDEGRAKTKNTKRDVIAQAYSLYTKMSQSEIIDALYMFGKDGSELDPEVAKERLGDIVEETPARFLQVIGDDQFKDKVWMMKLVKEGVIKKHGTGKGTNMPLYFHDIMLGNGLEEAIAFVKDAGNQEIYLGLKKEEEAKKKK